MQHEGINLFRGVVLIEDEEVFRKASNEKMPIDAVDKILTMYRLCGKTTIVAKKLGLHKATVRKYLKKYGAFKWPYK